MSGTKNLASELSLLVHVFISLAQSTGTGYSLGTCPKFIITVYYRYRFLGCSQKTDIGLDAWALKLPVVSAFSCLRTVVAMHQLCIVSLMCPGGRFFGGWNVVVYFIVTCRLVRRFDRRSGFWSMMRIHEILVWIRIRIRGSMPLTNGSGFGTGPGSVSVFLSGILNAFWRKISVKNYCKTFLCTNLAGY